LIVCVEENDAWNDCAGEGKQKINQNTDHLVSLRMGVRLQPPVNKQAQKQTTFLVSVFCQCLVMPLEDKEDIGCAMLGIKLLKLEIAFVMHCLYYL
jgi:hypothetical protein